MTKPKPNPEDTTPAPRKKGGVTYHGSIPDDDPRYQGGWNFLSGKESGAAVEQESRTPRRTEAAGC